MQLKPCLQSSLSSHKDDRVLEFGSSIAWAHWVKLEIPSQASTIRQNLVGLSVHILDARSSFGPRGKMLQRKSCMHLPLPLPFQEMEYFASHVKQLTNCFYQIDHSLTDLVALTLSQNCYQSPRISLTVNKIFRFISEFVIYSLIILEGKRKKSHQNFIVVQPK